MSAPFGALGSVASYVFNDPEALTLVAGKRTIKLIHSGIPSRLRALWNRATERGPKNRKAGREGDSWSALLFQPSILVNMIPDREKLYQQIV